MRQLEGISDRPQRMADDRPGERSWRDRLTPVYGIHRYTQIELISFCAIHERTQTAGNEKDYNATSNN